jgi:ferredoxin-type protein NapF
MRPRPAPGPAAIRPPWTSARSLAEHCTHCGDCIAACPEHILIPDRDGAPQVDFSRGGCTFCGDCATSCRVPVFDRAVSPPWHVRATITDRCLPRHGILCESCADVCADGAIRFARAPGRAPIPTISHDSCTGCGACMSICPASAIGVAPSHEAADG